MSQVDEHTRTWKNVKIHCGKQVTKALETLAEPGLGEVPTEFERGRVAAYRDVLSLPEEEVETIIQEPDAYK